MKERNKESHLNNNIINIGWVKIPIGNIIIFEYGKGLISTKRNRIGNVPVFGSNGIVGFHSSALVNKPCLIIGRKGAAGAVHISNVPCWPIDTTYYVIPPTGINIRFLFYFLSELNLNCLDKSTAIPGLNRNDAYSISIPIPPANEQNRIVEKIEELFTKFDAGVAALEKVRAQLKRYRQAVLKAAFSGQLTAEWRQKHSNVGVGSSRPFDPSAQKTQNKLAAKGATTAPLPNSDLPDLPVGWEWTTLNNCSVLITKGESPKWQGFNYVTDGILFIRSENVLWGSVDVIGAAKIPIGFHNKLKRSQLQKNDVLINLVGASIGRAAIFYEEAKSANINQAVALIRLESNLTSKYLLNLLLSPLIQSSIHSNKVETARPNISLADLRELIIPLPSIFEQYQIVSEIERRFSVADEVEKTVKNALKQARRMRQSILKMAFEGKLVPQDPKDEPAEKLLERIRAEKAKMTETKKMRKKK